jgi:polyisoprenoid-binding protein YceI
MKHLSLILVCLIVTTEGFSQRKISSNVKASSITYAMKHPLHSWDASSKESKCVIVYNDASQKITAVAVSIPVKSFDSGNSNRDSHALEEMESLKYPNVTFSASDIVETDTDITLKGNLTFHGVTKPITIAAKKNMSGKKMNVKGGFSIKMTDHKITPPGLMGIKTEDNINLKFDIVFDL